MNKDKSLDEKEIIQFCKKNKQDALLSTLTQLPEGPRKTLIQDLSAIHSIYEGIPMEEKKVRHVMPLQVCESYGISQQIFLGHQAICKGKVACLIFAAGHGTRFNFSKAKGLYPLTKYTKKSLFALQCDGIRAYKKIYDVDVPLLILVSKENRRQIQEHFQENEFFQLDPSSVFFIEQRNYPFFDQNHQWMVLDNYTIAKGPNGNGGFLDALEGSKVLHILAEKNIAYLHVLFIDNPLIDPLDPNLTGFLEDKKLDAALQVFTRDDPQEKVGLICQDRKKHFVVEYTQMDTSVFAPSKKEILQYRFGYSGHFCLKLSSLTKFIKKGIPLPYHWVWKKVDHKNYAWKGEKFAFDLFFHLRKVLSLNYEKNFSFAPLKQEKDIVKAQRLLALRDKKIFYELYQKNPLEHYELTMEDLIAYIQKKNLNS